MIDFGGVVQAYYSVTAQGCIPVLESYRGELEGSKTPSYRIMKAIFGFDVTKASFRRTVLYGGKSLQRKK